MKFKTKIKFNCALSGLCILLGAAVISMGILRGDGKTGIEMFLISGAGLVILGLIRLIRYTSALNNKEKFEQLKINHSDERVLHLAHKSGYVAFIISLLSCYLYSLYLLLIESPLFETLSYLCSIPLCIYLLCYVVIRKLD
jgi:uncharacterized membrane protein